MPTTTYQRRDAYVACALVFIGLSVVSFFLTPNPYSALHSGRTGLDSPILSESFAIQPNFITVAALLFAYFYIGRTRLILPLLPVFWSAWLFVSGIATAVLFVRPQTYVYDAFLPFVVAALAYYDGKSTYDPRKYHLLFRTLTLVALAGGLLALIRPNVWGYLPLEFSRSTRGENTLANMTAVYVLVPTLSLTINTLPRIERIAAYLFVIFIALSTVSRTAILITVLPLLLFILTQRKGIFQSVLSLGVLVGAAYLFLEFSNMFILNVSGESTIQATLNGRLALWSYYWDHFRQSPLSGSGAFLLERAINYAGRGVSEIGVLKTATEYGALAAVFQLCLVSLAGAVAIAVLRRKAGGRRDVVTALVVLSLIPDWLTQAHSRILDLADLTFWYSALYLVFLRFPVLRRCVRIKWHGSRVEQTTKFNSIDGAT